MIFLGEKLMVKIYLITLLGSCFLAYIAEKNVSYDKSKRKRMNLFVWGLMIFLIIISGFRYLNYSYSDEWAYRTASPDKILYLSDILKPEGLNTVLAWLSKYKFSAESGPFAYGQFYILITSIIVITLFVKSIWDYSEHFTFSMFLFVTMGLFFTSMNIIRQFIAIAILFYGFRFVKNKSFLKYLVCVLLAYGFHASAIIMAPLYFLIKQEKLYLWSLVLILASFLMMNRVDAIGNLLFEDSKYSIYFDTFGDEGVNILRILSTAIPCSIVLIWRRWIVNQKKAEYCEVNMLVITLIVCVFSSMNIYFNRISYYFSVAALIMFPKIQLIFTENSKRLVLSMMIVLFFLFGLYQASISASYHNILFETISGVL